MLHNQLKRKRSAAGLTQKQLGKLAGVPQERISQYERGTMVPSVETLERLASVLGPITVG